MIRRVAPLVPAPRPTGYELFQIVAALHRQRSAAEQRLFDIRHRCVDDAHQRGPRLLQLEHHRLHHRRDKYMTSISTGLGVRLTSAPDIRSFWRRWSASADEIHAFSIVMVFICMQSMREAGLRSLVPSAHVGAMDKLRTPICTFERNIAFRPTKARFEIC